MSREQERFRYERDDRNDPRDRYRRGAPQGDPRDVRDEWRESDRGGSEVHEAGASRWDEGPGRGARRRHEGRWHQREVGYRDDDDFDPRRARSFGDRPYGERASGRRPFDERERTTGIHQVEAWMVAGPYTGRGPKGYRRSDEQLVEEVCQRLQRHGEVDASEIEVTCKEGVVNLDGRVESRQMKRQAEECAETVYGVQDVMNRLEVERGLFSKLFGGREGDVSRGSDDGEASGS